jgi:hypothetical protein
MKRAFQSFVTRFRAHLLTTAAYWSENLWRRLRPGIGDIGSLTICPSCGLITSHHRKLRLECGKSLEAV